MMSTEDHKYCEPCFNHGLKVNLMPDHHLNCQFVHCKCDKCSHFVVINRDKQLILRKSKPTKEFVNDVSINKSQINTVHKFSQTHFPPRDPLEAVKTFAHQLSTLDISETNFRTSVLYALLKNNQFSIEDTKRKLFEARTAITESLLLSINTLNTNTCDKGSNTSLQSITISDDSEDSFTPIKKFCSESIRFTAKKSFPHFSPVSKTDSKPAIISVETNEQKPVLKSPTSVAPTKTNISPKPIQIRPKILSKPSISSFNNGRAETNPSNSRLGIGSETVDNNNINQKVATTYILPMMPLVNLQPGINPTFIQFPFPIQSKTVVTSSTPQTITSLPQSIVTTNTPQAITLLPKTASTSMTIDCFKGMNTTSIRANNIIGVRPSKNKLSPAKRDKDCALKGIKINSITKVPTNSVFTNTITHVSTNKKPEIKTYSRISNISPKQNKLFENSINDNNDNNKLCAKIITNEAALAALSAISNTCPSKDAQKKLNSISSTCEPSEKVGNYIEEDVEYILPDENILNADESSDNPINSFVINRCDNPLTPNVVQNIQSSNNQIEFIPTSAAILMPITDSLVLSQNSVQKSTQVPVSSRVHKMMNKKFKEGATDSTSHLNIPQQSDSNNDQNIVQITID